MVTVENHNNFAVDIEFDWNGWDADNHDSHGHETFTIPAKGEQDFGGHGGDSYFVNKVFNMRVSRSEN